MRIGFKNIGFQPWPTDSQSWQTLWVHKEIVDVIGMGVRTPFGVGIEPLFDGLCRLQPRTALFGPFVDAGMKYPFAAPLPDGCLEDENAGDSLDRGTRLLEAVVRDALKASTGVSDLSALGVRPNRVGLFVGTSSGGIGALTRTIQGATDQAEQARYDAGTQWVGRSLGILGPTQVTCSVCASGAQAIEEACGWLALGLVDVAIAAGYDALEPFVGAGFDALGATAERAFPFRACRSGLVLGEGAAALVLALPENHDFAVLGRVLGCASASDAHHVTAPHPEGRGVALALRRALLKSQLLASDLGALHAHGTSTVLNDRMEARAFESVFGPRAGGLPVYTVKGTIGHTLGAAGAIEAVVSIESHARGILPPTCTQGSADPLCDLDLVVEPRMFSGGPTASISAGFGGVNCVLIVEGAKK